MSILLREPPYDRPQCSAGKILRITAASSAYKALQPYTCMAVAGRRAKYGFSLVLVARSRPCC
jgi:hypothetical protein